MHQQRQVSAAARHRRATPPRAGSVGVVRWAALAIALLVIVLHLPTLPTFGLLAMLVIGICALDLRRIIIRGQQLDDDVARILDGEDR